MNAQEQYQKYSTILEGLMTRAEELHARNVIGAIPALEAYDMTLAQTIISDLKLKIQAYGDKAYPMTEKQETAVKRAFKAEFDRLQELSRQYNAVAQAEKAAEAAAPVQPEHSEDESLEEFAQWLTGKSVDEIVVEVAADNPPWQPGEFDRMMTTLDTDGSNFVSVTEAAERAGVNRSFIKAEIKVGRLVAKKIGNQYAIQQSVFLGWLNNPKRGSRQ